MIIKLLSKVGDPPIILPIAEFIVCQDNGTPIAVGAEYGPPGTQAISMVGMPDFQRVLAMLGINETILVDTLRLPQPPSGARLLTGPKA